MHAETPSSHANLAARHAQTGFAPAQPPAGPAPHGTAAHGAPAIQHAQAPQHAAPPAQARPAAPLHPRSTAFVPTGQYQLSGDPHIDRMLMLEQALKRFGSPL